MTSELDTLIENVLPEMGKKFPDGDTLLNAQDIRDQYGDPYAKLQEVFGPVAKERELRIYAIEEHDGPKYKTIYTEVEGVMDVEWLPADRFHLYWEPNAASVMRAVSDE